MKTALDKLSEQTGDIASELLRDIHPDHGFPHTERVVKHAMMIGRSEELSSADMELLLVAAWLHDIGRIMDATTIVNSIHATHSAEMAESIVEKLGYIEEAKNLIIQAIAEHSNREAATSEIGRILQDADKIDRFGRVGLDAIVTHSSGLTTEQVADFLLGGPMHQQYREELAKVIKRVKWCEEWYGWLNTATAKIIGLAPYAELIGYRVMLESR